VSIRLKAEDRGWVAGLLEGEGSFSVRNVRDRDKTTGAVIRTYRYPKIEVVTTDRDVIERLQTIVGGGNIYPRHADGRNLVGHGRLKDQWVWSLYDQATIAALLRQIRPLMSTRRAARIDELLLMRGRIG
jgi:hypothetical protein